MMAVYFGLILAFVGAMWWFNAARQKRLDADPEQHRLAELMTGAVMRMDAAQRQAALEHLNRISSGAANRRVRLTHAVMLVRSEAAPDLYDKVLALSREF